MIIYGILVAITLAGIGAVILLLKNDSDKDDGHTSATLSSFDETFPNAGQLLATPTPLSPGKKEKKPEKEQPPQAPHAPAASVNFNALFASLTKTKNAHPDLPLAPIMTPEKEPAKKGLPPFLTKLSTKFKLPTLARGKKDAPSPSPRVEPVADITDLGIPPATTPFEKDMPAPQPQPLKAPQVGTASLVTRPAPSIALSPTEEARIEKEIAADTELTELKEKYRKTETLLAERTNELDHIKGEIHNEKETRKEFNKVKDILEKELKDTRTRVKELQGQLDASQTEITTYKKRITLLESDAIAQAATHAVAVPDEPPPTPQPPEIPAPPLPPTISPAETLPAKELTDSSENDEIVHLSPEILAAAPTSEEPLDTPAAAPTANTPMSVTLSPQLPMTTEQPPAETDERPHLTLAPDPVEETTAAEQHSANGPEQQSKKEEEQT